MFLVYHMQETNQSQMSIPGRVLIVGAGLTGSLTACLLRRKFQNIDVTIWEKSRGVGGRMTTARSHNDPMCRADTGAQYISATPSYFASHESFYKELLTASVLVPFSGLIEGEKKQDGVQHFVAPEGTSSIAKYFINQSDSTVEFHTHCSEINESDGKQQWKVTDLHGNTTNFDAIVITIPTPQILSLKGTIATIIEEHRSVFESVRYSSRYALGLFYDQNTEIPFPWVAKYVTGDPCIRFVSVDSKKRGKDKDSLPPSLVVHTSVPFGIEHLESPHQEVEQLILTHLYKLFPDLPKPRSVKFQKWRYSQVSTPVVGEPGCLVLNTIPLVIAGGDAFVHSNFDGCVESALAIVKKFTSSKM